MAPTAESLNAGDSSNVVQEDSTDFYQYVSLEDIADPVDDPYISPSEESEGMDESDSSIYGSGLHSGSSSDGDIYTDDWSMEAMGVNWWFFRLS